MIGLLTLWSQFGTTTIFRRRSSGSVVYEHEGRIQSEIDKNGISLAYYIHALYGLILQVETRRILMIGCGGGTLATMLCRAGRSIKIVDIDPSSFALAKDYFSLPQDVLCHVDDGKEFLRSDSDIYDVIVIDAFHGSHVPARFCSERFYELLQGRLAPGGAIFLNVIVNDALDIAADQIAKAMSGFFSDVRILETPSRREHNAIVMAGAVSRLRRPRLIMQPSAVGNCVEDDMATMKFRTGRFGHDG